MAAPTKNPSLMASAGYTLVEVMVATAVFGIASAAIISFFLYGINNVTYNEGKLLVNRDVREFTTELSANATYANDFQIFTSYSNRSLQADGSTGDFMLLDFRDPSNDSTTSRLVGYYRDVPNELQEGPVRKFDISFNPPIDSTTIMSNLPSVGIDTSLHPEVIELSKGLADNRLFYNFEDRSVMVRGEIIHQGSTTKRATNTYNFTVSPRG